MRLTTRNSVAKNISRYWWGETVALNRKTFLGNVEMLSISSCSAGDNVSNPPLRRNIFYCMDDCEVHKMLPNEMLLGLSTLDALYYRFTADQIFACRLDDRQNTQTTRSACGYLSPLRNTVVSLIFNLPWKKMSGHRIF